MNRQKRLGPWFLGSFVFLFSSATLAAPNHCQPPATPKLPSAVTDKTEFNALSATVEKYLTDGADHLACLAAFADRNQDVLSDREKVALKNQNTSHLQKTRAFTERSNKIARVYLASN